MQKPGKTGSQKKSNLGKPKKKIVLCGAIMDIYYLVLLFFSASSIALLATSCNGDHDDHRFSKSTPLSHFVRTLDPANIVLKNVDSNKNVLSEMGSDDRVLHHNEPWETWQLWMLLVLGFLILFLVVFYFWNFNPAKQPKHETNLEDLAHQSPSNKAVDHEEVKIIIKTEEETRHSDQHQLVFFVEEDEQFTLDDLLEGSADLRTQGFCSSLYTVQLKNNVVLAVKRLKMLKVSSEEFDLTMTMIGKMRHPNILPLVCYSSTPDEKLLIYRYQRNGSLLNLFENYVEGKRAFPWKLRLSIGLGIARGLEFIYRKRDDDVITIPHGNIKLSNIILNDDEEALISEYGYSKFLDQSRVCLFLKGYTAPEKALSEKADVYSFGVILLELLTGKIVEKSGLDLPRYVRAIVREEWTGEVFDKKIVKDEMYAFPMLNVSLKCVDNNPEERPTFAEVLERIEEIVNSQ